MDTLIENATAAIGIINNFKYYCSEGNRLVIPEGVTEIKGGIFFRDADSNYSTSNLASVTFPSTLRKIGYQSFRGQIFITELEIPHGVTTIASNAFSGCNSLQSLSLPNTLTMIYGNGFTPTANLTNLTLEENFNCNLSTNVDFSNSILTTDSLNNIVTSLKDRSNETSSQQYSIQLGQTNYNNLTAAQKQTLEDKYWNVLDSNGNIIT